ncbi:MAG: uracil-DNA glycosylase [Euryarchaeota archaeon]|nr:uracil-DNA glycosylase [Euryarchaeota archaeon]
MRGVETLDELRARAEACTRCPLHRGRTRVVFGEGPPDAKVMFVGEGPGYQEDRQGRPFVGDAGKILTQLIEAAGMRREEVYIANVVKCRPPGNRAPEPGEAEACAGYLDGQLHHVNPRIVVALGRIAARRLLGREIAVGKEHGRLYPLGPRRLLVTYHPAACLYGKGVRPLLEEDFRSLGRMVKEVL